jgi:hypothetical protein
VAVKPDPDDKLIAGAEAAASWARARRAKWTNKPLEVPDATPPDEPTEFEFEFEPQPPPTAAAPLPPPPVTVAPPPRPAQIFVTPASEPVIEPLSASVHETPVQSRHLQTPAPVARRPRTSRARGAPMPRWVSRVGIAAALIIVAVAVAPYALNRLSNATAPGALKVAERRPESSVVTRKPAGTLSVTSTPPGAQVLVDGKPRGVTPLQLADLSPGRHDVALTSDAGEVRRTITVAAGKTVTLDEAIFSGWIAVYSPFEITVAEGGRVLRPDDRSQIMLTPGAHTLRFVNKTLGYDESRQVDVKPGEGTPIRLTPEPSKLTVTATEPADVWIDGARIGEAPLNGVAVTLGTHEIIVRRTAGGERRFTVSIGVAPYQLHVDFSQPGA